MAEFVQTVRCSPEISGEFETQRRVGRGLSANRWEARIHRRYRAAGSDSAAAAVAMGYRAEKLIEIPDMAPC